MNREIAAGAPMTEQLVHRIILVLQGRLLRDGSPVASECNGSRQSSGTAGSLEEEMTDDSTEQVGASRTHDMLPMKLRAL